MNISEIKVNDKAVTVEGEIIEISPVKEFSKFGRVGRVATATIKDSTGEIQLTLWDEQTEMLSKGSKIRILNGYVKEWQGLKQLNIGRQGNLEVIS